MPYTDLISRRALRTLAAQIGNRLEMVNSLEDLTAESTEIAESLTEWRLERDGGGSVDDTPFRARIRPTGRWHHQVRLDGRARLYARSAPLSGDGSDWMLRETVVSAMAGRIDEAIQWLDATMNTDDDTDVVVRLLYVSSPAVMALWLAADDPAKDRILSLDTFDTDGDNALQLQETSSFLRSLQTPG